MVVVARMGGGGGRVVEWLSGALGWERSGGWVGVGVRRAGGTDSACGIQ